MIHRRCCHHGLMADSLPCSLTLQTHGLHRLGYLVDSSIMCVCMYVCMHACMYVCMYARMDACMYVRMCVRTYVYMYVFF